MGPGRERSRLALASYVADQCEAILTADRLLSTVPSAADVHRARVAIRRLRSTVRTFSTSFGVAGGLSGLRAFEGDLRWLAGLLGPVRDADVIADGVADALSGLPAGQVLGPVQREVAETSAIDRRRGLDRLALARAEPRYTSVMTTVRNWREDPPLGGRHPALRRRLHSADARLCRRLAVALATDDPDDFHRARKAAKRLRYAAEATHGLVREAVAAGRAARRLQASLGEHQDQIVLAEHVRRLAVEHGAAEGHNGFTYGVLHAGALARAAQIRATFR